MILAVVALSSREEIRVSRPDINARPCRGQDVVDVRIWTQTKNSYRPTGKGLVFEAKHLHHVIRALVDITNGKGGAH